MGHNTLLLSSHHLCCIVVHVLMVIHLFCSDDLLTSKRVVMRTEHLTNCFFERLQKLRAMCACHKTSFMSF